MRSLRLRPRLTVWFAASLLLILTPYLIGVLVLEWRSMRAALDHHLEEDLQVALEMLVVQDGRVLWRSDAARDLGYDAAEQRWVEVYAVDGQPLLFRGLAARAEIRQAMPAPAETAGFRSSRTPAGAHVRTRSAQRKLGPLDVWVRVARSEDALRSDLTQLVFLFSVGTPLAVLGAALAGYFISGRALSPLSRMAERARTISADRLSERLPVENPDDELGQLARVFNDTFARLESSFERLRRFTADASHELRTPLTAIRSVGEVGLRDVHDARGYQEIIGSMLEETDRLAQLVDTLLTLSRWDSGRGQLAASQIDLAELARETAGQLAVLAEDREVTIDVTIDRRLPIVADMMTVRQALMNVVSNAIKFTGGGTRVHIWAKSDIRDHHVIVDDQGSGIPSAERAHVLERFYRIDDGRARSTGGAGLGLAIVQWAVTANRGRVGIDSNEYGGARVILTFRRADLA